MATRDPNAQLDQARYRVHLDINTGGVTVGTEAKLGTSAASAIGAVVEQHPEVLVVMASHGRGRSAAVLGSVAEDLLQRTYGPILIVGPRSTVRPLTNAIHDTSNRASAP